MDDKEDLSKRLLKTKKEREELEAQLQKLIDLGKNNFNIRSPECIIGETERTPSPNKVQIVKSYDPVLSKHINKNIPKSSSKITIPNSNDNVKSKKSKGYDINEAREYIKKQKEKRLELQKNTKEDKINAEIRKKKLDELHKKSLELVTRNVQLNRARSRSSGNDNYLRLDVPKRSRSVSKDRNQIAQKKSVNIPNQNNRGRPVTRKQEYMVTKLINKNVHLQDEINIVGKSKRENQFSSVETNINTPNKINSINEVCSKNVHKETVSLVNGLKETENHKNADDQIITQNSLRQIQSISENHPSDNKVNILSNITIKSPTEIQNDTLQNGSDTSHVKELIMAKGTIKSPITLKSPIEVQNILQKSSENIKTNIQQQSKKSKENVNGPVESVWELLNNQTAGNTKNKFPAWLQEAPAQSYPFNFINTVKRKLQFVGHSPQKSTVDVGIQSSIPEKVQFEKSPIFSQSKLNPVPELGSASNMKSYISHNYMNLDSESIKHVELVPTKISKSTDSSKVPIQTLTENKEKSQITETESESDTSKNIPEISSESRSSLMKNAKSVCRNLNVELGLAISTEKLNDMKLVPHIQSSRRSRHKHSVRKNKLKSPEGEFKKSSGFSSTKNNQDVQYISDFNSSTEDDVLSSCSSKSRESILSFNSPEYSIQYFRSPKQHENDADDVNSEPFTVKTVTLRTHSINETPIDSTSFLNEAISEKINSKKSSRESYFTNIPSIKVINATLVNDSTDGIPYNDSSSNDVVKTASSSVPVAQSAPKNSISSRPDSTILTKPKLNSPNVNTKRGSGGLLRKECLTDIPPLEDPKVSLIKFDNKSNSKHEHRKTVLRNVSIRKKNETNGNEVHLKFEAEIHLLNDFNKSLKQFSAAEKVFKSLKNDNEEVVSKILQNRDTQTSTIHKSSETIEDLENIPVREKTKSDVSSINFNRGTVLHDSSNDTYVGSVLIPKEDSLMSNLNISKNSSVINNGNDMLNITNNFAGFSLNMFDQLIKDEDARLDNLKTILKIREKILLDRTKAELAWLEIQRKHYKETGNLQEASVAKKKQRAILLNHEKEKHEMMRIKQMQRAASADRKTILKQQRNLIMKKLSTDNMLKMRVRTPRERKSTGPLKVVQSHTESIMSETSLSMKSSSEKEVYSILSHRSVSKITELEMALPTADQISQQNVETSKRQEHIKKILLMRESELKKRRKSVEQLMQWQKRLVEEEQRINELEVKANTVISQKLSTNDVTEKYKFKGRQLNQLWYNVTGIEEKKFIEDKIYQMSQIALERFCKSAREYSTKTKKLLKASTSDYSDSSVSEKIRKTKQISDKESQKPVNVSTNEYTSDFESIANEENAEVIENISELINNFGKIKTNILSISITSSKSSEDKHTTAKTDSDLEVSVIETNRTSKDDEKESSLHSVEEEVKTVDSEIKISSVVNEEIEKDILATEQIDPIRDISDLIKFDETDNNVNAEKSIISDRVTTENLNESKEILLLLGEPEEKIDIDFKIPPETDKGKENVDTSEDILLTLTQIDQQSSTSSVKSSLEEFSKEVDDNIKVILAPKLNNKVETVSTQAIAVTEQNESIHSEENTGSKLSILEAINTDSSKSLQEIKVRDAEIRSNKENVAELVEENDILESETANKESRTTISNITEDENILESPVAAKVSKTESQLENKTTDSILEDNDKLESAVTAEDSKIKLESETTASDIIEDNDISKIQSRLENETSDIEENSENKIEDTEISSKNQISTDEEDENEVSKSEIEKESISSTSNLQDNHIADTEQDIAESKSDSSSVSEISEETSEKSTGAIPKDPRRTLKIPLGPRDSPETPKAEKILQRQPGTDRVSVKKLQFEAVPPSVDLQFEHDELVQDDTSAHEGFGKQLEEKTADNSPCKLENGISEDENPLPSIQNGNVAKESVEIDVLNLKISREDDTIRSNDKAYEDNSEGSYKIADIEEVLSEDESEIKNNNYKDNKLESSENEFKIIIEEFKTDTSESALESSHLLANNIEENDKSSKSSSDKNKSIEETSVVNSYTNSFASQSASSNSHNTVLSDHSQEKSIGTGSAKSTSPLGSPRNGTIDVKKRVLEIMTDASQVSRGDKSPKLQDLYVTTYDLTSPTNSPESGSPVHESKLITATIFGNEAEEILKKQLAIEQEIKQITEQQQREQQIPFVYVREIPNKPPPPYTPPSSQVHLTNVITINPTNEEIDEISKYSSKILYKAYLSKNLDNISISENTLSLISKNIPKERYKYVFDLCKDLARQQYQQFQEEKGPSWMRVPKKPHLNIKPPLDAIGLEKYIAAKLKEIFGFEKAKKRESAITKWSKKKHDHVDEILVKECQNEEVQWTNYEKDELLVMDQITNDIMDALLKETGEIFNKILTRKS